jgi:DNA integrity scanning protein DisA with diadenylate cyclase activity
LLEIYFCKKQSLHDGAAIHCKTTRIKAARCVLPVSENIELPAHLGLRHRAAIGVTEQSDCTAIVVSEEGEISVAKRKSVCVFR